MANIQKEHFRGLSREKVQVGLALAHSDISGLKDAKGEVFITVTDGESGEILDERRLREFNSEKDV